MRWTAALCGLGLLAVTGCTAGAREQQAGTPDSATVTEATTPAPTTSAAPEVDLSQLPAGCPQLLSITEVDAALGVPMPGQISYIRGEPLPQINRTGRINCGYGIVIGLDGEPDPPLLEVSVFTYSDAASAAERIEVTVESSLQAGDTRTQVTVGGLPGAVLTGVGDATLVFADRIRTYSLTLLPGVVPPESTDAGLVAVAEAVLARAAQAPPT
ncbi:hypothetical protein BH20ACT5_BH20ACT5_13170 [soil metagenome]